MKKLLIATFLILFSSSAFGDIGDIYYSTTNVNVEITDDGIIQHKQ